MLQNLEVISPIDGSIYYKTEMHNQNDIDAALILATNAQTEWKKLSISERKEYALFLMS